MFEHEIIQPDENISFRIFTFEGQAGDYVRGKHWHSDLEIFAVFSGELDFYIDDRRYVLKQGSFMLLNSYDVHFVVAKKCCGGIAVSCVGAE